MARVSEALIFGTVVKALEAAINDVTFYPGELEPDVTNETKWALVDVETDDSMMRVSEWLGQGNIKIHIQSRKADNGVYATKDIANSISVALSGQAFDVVNNASSTVGTLVIRENISRPLGEVDGVIDQYWQAPFIVNNV